jgi:multidrug resistance efflux pump
VVSIAPQVSGRITEVRVDVNEGVVAGQVLATIRRDPFELAMQQAEANLEQAGQATGVDTAAIKASQADVANARSKLKLARLDLDQVQRIYDQDPGAVSKREMNRRRTNVDTANGRLASARANLEKAKQQLGRQGKDNARIRAAKAALDQARFDLAQTVIYAPERGGISNLQVSVGYFANAGQPIMTFVSASNVWVEANMRENSLSNVKTGDPVEIALDVAPGKIFKGKVVSIGFGVDEGTESLGSLAQVETTSGFLRESQRFPVIIRFTDDDSIGYRRHGGQADVIIYTRDRSMLNMLGRVWIRVLSYLSYVY